MTTDDAPAADGHADWLERLDAIHATGYMNWITASWAMMFIKQGILPKDRSSDVAKVLLEMRENPISVDEAGPHMYRGDAHFIRTLGDEVGGSVMMARTQPSMRQTLEVRHRLLKQMCRIYDLVEATLDRAEEQANTVMPGYTHFRHAQPTTFGHYLLSVADAISRSTESLEHACHLMSLNEMGCGALAGTSWPIDRDLVGEYLGTDGLIENANDAVCFTDGYLSTVAGLTNITNIASRIALDLSYWSGVEYGFLDIGGRRGLSFMMPQKEGNPNSMEIVRQQAGHMLGHLTGVAAAGLRAPHGDVFEMLTLSKPALAALDAAETCTTELTNEIRKMTVHEDRMLGLIRESYLAATELANQMVRDHDMGYRVAHDIVHTFVVESQNRGIPATKADIKLLEKITQDVTGRQLGMTEQRLRELLDPEHFIDVTNSRGGVSRGEIARMLHDRRQKLDEARARHLRRIEKLEAGQRRLVADLQAAANA
jgi:argininosuccinate lyase